jgi:hypothetical protein
MDTVPYVVFLFRSFAFFLGGGHFVLYSTLIVIKSGKTDFC